MFIASLPENGNSAVFWSVMVL